MTTLAPGSTPGTTAIPLNTRILAAMDKVHLLESSWSWFGSAEERVSGEIFKWKNLAYFKNWVDQGTAYASPDYRANWSGLMNDDNGRGIVRVSDNVKTPGLKLWTFGPQQSEHRHQRQHAVAPPHHRDVARHHPGVLDARDDGRERSPPVE